MLRDNIYKKVIEGVNLVKSSTVGRLEAAVKKKKNIPER